MWIPQVPDVGQIWANNMLLSGMPPALSARIKNEETISF